MKRTYPYTFVLAACALLVCAASAFLLNIYGKKARTYAGPTYSLAGPDLPVTVVDTSEALYRLYKSRKVRGRVLLHIGKYLQAVDMDIASFIPTDRYPVRIPPMLPIYERSLSYRNVFWLASQANIIREIVYFQPPGMFQDRLAVINDRDSDFLSKNGNIIVLQDWGSRRTISDRLPQLREPVLLNIDASVFEELRPEQLLSTLRSSALTADIITLNLSRDNPDVSGQCRTNLLLFAGMLAREGQR